MISSDLTQSLKNTSTLTPSPLPKYSNPPPPKKKGLARYSNLDVVRQSHNHNVNLPN